MIVSFRRGWSLHPLRRIPPCLPGLVCVLLFSPALARQADPSPPTQSSSRASHQESPWTGPVTFAGSVRGRVENWGWFETPGAQDSYTFGGFQLQLALSRKTDRLEWLVEGIFPALVNLPTDAVRPAPQGQLGLGGTYFAASGHQDTSAVFRQGFARIRGIFGDPAGILRLGRFEFSDGAEVAPKDPTLASLKRTRIAQRLIGPFGFSHVGRGFDGVEYVRDTASNNLTLLAARPTEGVFQLRSLDELNVDFYYGAFTRPLARSGARGETRYFALHYHDGRDVLKTDNRPAALRAADTRDIRLTTLGGHYAGVLGEGPGKADFLVWGAGQFGHWGLLEHRAWAVAIEGGYQFPVSWKPWVRAGCFRSTGDGNADDNKHTTFFQVLPTPRVYARFPIYNLMNSQDVFGELRFKPAEKLSLRTEVHSLQLSDRRDLWYAGGGAFQKETFGYLGRPGSGHSSLGTLFDLSVDYSFTPRTAVTLYLADLRGGGVEEAIYPAGGTHPGARFLYFEVVQRF
jgi:Alginate export